MNEWGIAPATPDARPRQEDLFRDSQRAFVATALACALAWSAHASRAADAVATAASAVKPGGQVPLSELRASADRGDRVSQYNLARRYLCGSGGADKDDAQALGWPRKSATRGTPEAQDAPGILVSSVRGVPRDDQKMCERFQTAAQQGDPQAKASLGARYETGHGVGRIAPKAFQGYRKAEEQGSAVAQNETP